MFERLNARELKSELMGIPIDHDALVDALVRLCEIVSNLEMSLARILSGDDLDNKDEDVLVTSDELPF